MFKIVQNDLYPNLLQRHAVARSIKMESTSSSDTILQRIDKIKESQIQHVQSISVFLVVMAKYLEEDTLILTSTNAMNVNLNPTEMTGGARDDGGSSSATATSALDFVKCYTELRNRVNTTLLDRQRRVLSNLKSFMQGLAGMQVDGSGNRIDGVYGDGLAVSKASMLWATFYKEVGTGYQSSILAGGKVTGGGGTDFGKWQSSFFKAMGKINDSVTRLQKYKGIYLYLHICIPRFRSHLSHCRVVQIRII